MAIPFNVPADQETQEIYRRIGQVLLEVYEIVARFTQLRQRGVYKILFCMKLLFAWCSFFFFFFFFLINIILFENIYFKIFIIVYIRS